MSTLLEASETMDRVARQELHNEVLSGALRISFVQAVRKAERIQAEFVEAVRQAERILSVVKDADAMEKDEEKDAKEDDEKEERATLRIQAEFVEAVRQAERILSVVKDADATEKDEQKDAKEDEKEEGEEKDKERVTPAAEFDARQRRVLARVQAEIERQVRAVDEVMRQAEREFDTDAAWCEKQARRDAELESLDRRLAAWQEWQVRGRRETGGQSADSESIGKTMDALTRLAALHHEMQEIEERMVPHGSGRSTGDSRSGIDDLSACYIAQLDDIIDKRRACSIAQLDDIIDKRRACSAQLRLCIREIAVLQEWVAGERRVAKAPTASPSARPWTP